MSSGKVLEVRNLSVQYRDKEREISALRNVSLSLGERETLGIVGESGCGKSTLALSLLNFLGPNGRARGEILFQETDLLTLSDREMNRIRGARIAMVGQNPFSFLNPSMRLGQQLAEVGRTHRGLRRKEARTLAEQMLGSLAIRDPSAIMNRFPHQISGGMQQRVCIAMALLCKPEILIMDEPTTALDVTTEVVILDLVRELRKEFHFSIIYISHDLGVIRSISDRIAVMYRGEVVEITDTDTLFSSPAHPYTEALIACIPRIGWTRNDGRLPAIDGHVTSRRPGDTECPFRDRCGRREPGCRNGTDLLEIEPGHWSTCRRAGKTMVSEDSAKGGQTGFVTAPPGTGAPETGEILRVEHLRTIYGKGRRAFRAVDDISFSVAKNGVLGIVGESGCGKSTTALSIQGLIRTSGGKILFRDQDINIPWQRRNLSALKAVQMVFQNPEGSLNPSLTIGQTIDRPLSRTGQPRSRVERRKMAVDILEKVGLSGEYLNRKPHQMSGGEKQRVAVARAFALNPDLIIFDEPTSSLDVSIQAAVLNLLVDLQKSSDTISYIFISHNLHVVSYISDHVLVMYLGKIMECGRTEEIFNPPHHPYTEALLSAVPEFFGLKGESAVKEPVRLEGPVPVSAGLVRGCPFFTRCHRVAGDICRVQNPVERKISGSHTIYCHLSEAALADDS